MSVENQKIIKLGKRAPWDSGNIYGRFHIDALQLAMNELKGETLKLWLYIAKNQDEYQFELSQKALLDWGLKKDSYYKAVNTLIELGYLTQQREGSNIYIFSEIPKK